MKTLSQLLEEYRPSRIKCSDMVEHTTFEEYYKLRSVAIELAESLEYYAEEIEGVKQVNVCTFNEKLNRMYVSGSGLKARNALSRAKDIIGEGKP